MNYEEFLAKKTFIAPKVGREIETGDVNALLFPFQRDIVRWAVSKGRAAIFADTGLGKTFMQIEWVRLIGERVLIVAPLSVVRQTVHEADKLGVKIEYVRSSEAVAGEQKIYITNYDMIEHFDAGKFGAVVLDESSILKSLDGKTRSKLIAMFKNTPYRLCCTATPAPNDITELANHAEFLGVMTRQEMLSVFFTYNNAKGGTTHGDSWRLKKHAIESFYRWLTSWAIAIKKPSDIGYDDTGYILPPLETELHELDSDYCPPGMLPGFFVGSISAIDAKAIRRTTIDERVEFIAKKVNASDKPWVVWCGLNEESDKLAAAIPDAINVYGAMSPEEKADGLEAFTSGSKRVLVSKTSIAGFGINMQHCAHMAFCGIDYSWEGFYQAVRRCWRFGQKNPVSVHIVTSIQERSVYESIVSKEKEAISMTSELIKASAQYTTDELRNLYHNEWKYKTDKATGEGWELWLGDSVERMKEIPSDSVDLSIYSPPFSDLFVYSATPRDVGNSKNLDEFFAHYSFIIRENLRITKPGRLACVHIQDTRSLKSQDGFIGRKDFSGHAIEAYQKEGWVFWQRITVDKNPQAQAIRLKDHGLLFKTLKKDSTDLSGGHADYLLIFKKPGENAVPVTPYDSGEVTSEDWISWAHPVWYDIRESDTLNVSVARSSEDEKHMCPLQLPLIERCVKLWSNRDEKIFSPFAGIGSEGYESLRWGRKFLGIELKPEYFEVAKRNLSNAEKVNGATLFDWADSQKVANS